MPEGYEPFATMTGSIPQCLTCGALVGDTEQHDEWHDTLHRSIGREIAREQRRNGR